MHRRVFSTRKQGARFGRTKIGGKQSLVRALNHPGRSRVHRARRAQGANPDQT